MTSRTRVAGLAIYPGTAHSLHLTELDLPGVGPSDVEVRVLQAGVCGTDRELIEGRFGRAPDDATELVIGHEMLGIVEHVGPDVSSLAPGDLVTATARRGCSCDACVAGESDFCAVHGYKERGILGLHGYYTERFVENVKNIVRVPHELGHIGVLVEPLSVPEKAWRVAKGVQSRIQSWKPRTAVVYGAGPIGLLGTLMLRAHGLEVHTIDLKPVPNDSEAIVHGCGGSYIYGPDHTVAELKSGLPNVDIIIECTGSTAPLGSAMQLLGINGVLVLLSGTGGTTERTIPADQINRGFVGGNKVMVGSVNSSLTDFRAAVDDLRTFEELWPRLAGKLITHRIQGLANGVHIMELGKGAVKAIIEVSRI